MDGNVPNHATFRNMKTRLIYTALAATMAATLPSCDEKLPDFFSGKPADQQPSAQDSKTPEVTETTVPTTPTPDDIAAAVMPQLSDYPWLAQGAITSDTATTAEGALQLTATVELTVSENLYQKESAPAAFNEERKAMNQSANAAMQPNSAYLLQIGAPTDTISDADRVARPLPDNLQQLANELKELAESSLYTVATPAGSKLTVTATMQADKAENGWVLSNVALQTVNLPAPDSVIPESALPTDAAKLTPEFEENRKKEIREKIAAFDQAAAPYIHNREEEARKTWLEYKARMEEEARKASEVATAAAAEKEQWINHCINSIATGKVFSGEWTRDTKFGEISIEISKAEKFENSVQFIGIVYDTKLPEAKLDISGRCEFSKTDAGTSKVDINIYDGYYDPDQPTAEVFDAKDGVLLLTLDADGKLSGSMTCTSWKEQPAKAFRISLTPASGKSKK